MAKVKIQGHASGTGVLTVTAPNTSTDRTITLPDSTGTLLSSEGAVTINDSGADVDFRVEGSGAANALFVQGSDGKVGIGTNSPTSVFEISGTGAQYSKVANGSNKAYMGVAGDNKAYFGSFSATDVVLAHGTSNKWTLNSSGNLFPAATSQGIVLGNTSDVAANRLDDYEEGTFTTTANAGSGTITLVSSQDLGAYVKIGSLVHWSLHIGVSSTSSASGDLYFTLPFTLGNFGETAGEGSFACWVWAATTGDSGTWVGWVERGSNRAYLRRGIGTQPGTSANLMTGGTEIRMSGTFRTA